MKRRVTFAVGGLLLALAVAGMIWRAVWLNSDSPKIGVRFVGFTTNVYSNAFLGLRLTNGTPRRVVCVASNIERQSDSGAWEAGPSEHNDIVGEVIRVGGGLTAKQPVPSATGRYRATIHFYEEAGPLAQRVGQFAAKIHPSLLPSVCRFTEGRTYSVQVTIPPP